MPLTKRSHPELIDNSLITLAAWYGYPQGGVVCYVLPPLLTFLRQVPPFLRIASNRAYISCPVSHHSVDFIRFFDYNILNAVNV